MADCALQYNIPSMGPCSKSFPKIIIHIVYIMYIVNIIGIVRIIVWAIKRLQTHTNGQFALISHIFIYYRFYCFLSKR